MRAAEVQEKIVHEMIESGGTFEQYDVLLQYSARLDELSDELKTDEALVEGCQSQVWLNMKWAGETIGSGFLLEADSDTLMVRGVLFILSQMFNGKSAQEILECNISFVEDTDLIYIFDAKRQTGIAAIVGRIREFCQSALENSASSNSHGTEF